MASRHYTQSKRGEAAESTRRRIVEATIALHGEQGIAATTMKQIAARAGVSVGSVYHHFPGGKDELVLAAVELAGEKALAVLERLAGKPADEVADAFIALWRLVLEKSGFRAGCAVAAVTVAADDPALIARAASVFRAWRGKLADLLASGGIPATAAPAAAATLISACEGAVILARAERSFEPFDLVAASQRAAIRSAMAPLSR